MKRSSSRSGTFRVQSNLLQQNCFVRDVTVFSESTLSPVDSFVSLDEVSDPSGIHFEEKVYPYPITPQYVDSFIDSSDYHKDPVGALNNAVSRRNLGDLTDLQNVSSMDMSTARALYSELSRKLSSAPSDLSSPSKSSDSEVK